MSAQLRQNLRAIKIAADATTRQAKDGRNRVVARYYARLPKSAQENLTYSHGRNVYRDKTLTQFFRLIEPRKITLSIAFTGGDDNTVLARAANDVYEQVYTRALSRWITGFHTQSLVMYFYEVNHHKRISVTSGTVTAGMMPKRTVVNIVATAPYASAIEADGQKVTRLQEWENPLARRGLRDGILYHVAKKAKAQYRNRLAVRYSYVHGSAFGLPGGTFPRIQIAHRGNLKETFDTPGTGGKSKRTRRGRGYAQAKGRSA